MSTAVNDMGSAISISASAVNRVKQMLSEEGNSSKLLRVYISGGGCSGFQYGFSFEDSAAEDDIQTETDGVKVIVDPMSFQYLMGSEIGYIEDLSGSRFSIDNPNASTTCGCGSSFSV